MHVLGPCFRARQGAARADLHLKRRTGLLTGQKLKQSSSLQVVTSQLKRVCTWHFVLISLHNESETKGKLRRASTFFWRKSAFPVPFKSLQGSKRFPDGFQMNKLPHPKGDCVFSSTGGQRSALRRPDSTSGARKLTALPLSFFPAHKCAGK